MDFFFNYHKKAWSSYFGAYIRCVKYISDTDWYFVINEDIDNRYVRKAGSKYSDFNWVRL